MITPYQIWIGVVLGALIVLRYEPYTFPGISILRALLFLALLPAGLSFLARNLANIKMYPLAGAIYQTVIAMERLCDLVPKNPYALGLPYHLIDLGNCRLHQNLYLASENALKEAVAVTEKHSSSESLTLILALSPLSRCLSIQGKYKESEKVNQKIVAVIEKLRPKLGDLAHLLSPAAGMSDLCGDLANQGRYEEAEAVGKRAIELIESGAVGANAKFQLANLALALNNLGVVYDGAGKFEEALAVYQRALSVKQKIYGELDKSVAIAHCNVGYVATNVGQLELAMKNLEDARRILVQLKRCDDNLWATVLNNIADVQRIEGKLDVAEATMLESFKWREKNLPPTNSHFAEGLLSLALLYRDKNEPDKADSYFQKTIANLESRTPVNNKKLGDALSEYVRFLRKVGKESQAVDLEARIAAIAQVAHGSVLESSVTGG